VRGCKGAKTVMYNQKTSLPVDAFTYKIVNKSSAYEEFTIIILF